MAEDASDNREGIRKEWFALFSFFPFDATSIPIEQLDHKSAAGKNKTSEQKAGLRESEFSGYGRITSLGAERRHQPFQPFGDAKSISG